MKIEMEKKRKLPKQKYYNSNGRQIISFRISNAHVEMIGLSFSSKRMAYYYLFINVCGLTRRPMHNFIFETRTFKLQYSLSLVLAHLELKNQQRKQRRWGDKNFLELLLEGNPERRSY